MGLNIKARAGTPASKFEEIGTTVEGCVEAAELVDDFNNPDRQVPVRYFGQGLAGDRDHLGIVYPGSATDLADGEYVPVATWRVASTTVQTMTCWRCG